MSIPSEEMVDLTAVGISDVSERGGEEIWVWSLVMEVFTEEDGGGSSKGESQDKGEVIWLG